MCTFSIFHFPRPWCSTENPKYRQFQVLPVWVVYSCRDPLRTRHAGTHYTEEEDAKNQDIRFLSPCVRNTPIQSMRRLRRHTPIRCLWHHFSPLSILPAAPGTRQTVLNVPASIKRPPESYITVNTHCLEKEDGRYQKSTSHHALNF